MAEPDPNDQDPGFTSSGVVRVSNNYLAGSGTGTTSSQDYMTGTLVINGFNFIQNNTLHDTSGFQSAFPQWGNSEVIVDINANFNWFTTNNVSGLNASAMELKFNHTSGADGSGGLEISGLIWTTQTGQIFIPVTQNAQTPSTGSMSLPNGAIMPSQGNVSTGMQRYSIMPMPGPWALGHAANTNTTVPTALLPIWQDLINIVMSQGVNGMMVPNVWPTPADL
jgi:hypothetical protein